MNYFSSDFKLGILGGGQLGKMLLFDTRKFDIQTYVLDPSDEAPCKIACNKFFKGDLMDFETVYNFGKKVDVLTFEIELVNLEALVKLEEEGVKVFPSPKTLKLIQNKGIQKDFYTQHTIPTANYKRFENLKSLIVDILDSKTKLPFVWKCTEFGYDGNGVKVIRQISDLDNLANVECIAEEMVPFKNELAVIVCRNPSGEIKTYPVVEMEFHPEANQVEYVICPARIDDKVAEKARAIALNVSEKFNHVGLLAVEMFQTEDDEILVNEVAPRPHNSGHYSIEASYTSQFENHLRAILNLPLGNTDSKVAGIMVNLSGEEGYSGDVVYENIEKILGWNGVTPHIYGKKQTRPFRKMGHVTIVNPDINEARRIAENVKNTIRVIS
ncbi:MULTISPECIES: 5-(carboxyamino)imidazole ribonucleotide synthase [Flavobacterium]|jgi:5-(carboxyamino)imidazole ribonucleotide synthase|uniref:N5-carboxyaminoimidazole ribonucleotide synthase n=1 Tax=Flavobacterium algoritolerans TaxID=3041254 RepID=A0ABT6VBT8_9FLAO|nr:MULTISPECIES: 5-(carboxyamino)imidazole ribonucleotide synthase [Flavobacterium]MDI5887529.1 5-(carboxyamino)imidazole ribonucleotide synthase [Flavobacterium yafengii]MDI5895696.1 5-(carboxyamino)imidazole ribonucleotide synthase [Flavobacterium algoritolerans]PIF60745.1 5-(carboxyamino)imidazole ribonucleotide synthase [Flavobacterium sp. 11]WKL45122.1 5-(carboxyamino)imidazole ribonucleotide synthase [Flavobacterium sp. ZE23DGlu08]